MELNVPQLARIRQRVYAILLESVLYELVALSIVVVCIDLIELADPVLEFVFACFAYFLLIITFDFFNYVVLARITGGKSIGKALAGIRIVKENGEKPGFGSLFFRWVVLASIALSLGWIGGLITFFVIRSSRLKQGWHDSAAGTIVVKSKTSRKKLTIIWVIYLLLLLASLTVIVIGSSSVISDLQKAEQVLNQEQTTEELKSLSGIGGLIAEFPEEKPFKEGYLEYQKALKSIEVDNYEKARSEIDMAFSKNQESELINLYRCFIYSRLLDSETAYNICYKANQKYPNNPSIIVNQLDNAYYMDNCGEVERLATIISDMRMGNDFDNDTRAIYYGNAGVNLSYCETNPELARKLLQAAQELSSLEEDKEFYQNYLDSY